MSTETIRLISDGFGIGDGTSEAFIIEAERPQQVRDVTVSLTARQEAAANVHALSLPVTPCRNPDLQRSITPKSGQLQKG